MRATTILSTAVLFSAIVPCGSAAEPEGWPQFLGPARNGIAEAKNLVDRFPEGGPTIVWRVPGGVGMSGIAIDGDGGVGAGS